MTFNNKEKAKANLSSSNGTITFCSTAKLPTNKFGEFEIHAFIDSADGKEHIALTSKLNSASVKGEYQLVRIHSSCVTGDIFGSLRCDCGKQLEFSMQKIGKEGGILIYLNQEGRGIGLTSKIEAYALQEQGLSTSEANIKLGFAPDLRQYHAAARILEHFGSKKIRLITNNPRKVVELRDLGFEVERLPTPIFVNEHNKKYLNTKRTELGHIIDEGDIS